MFRIGDKVEFPVTQSEIVNNNLSHITRSMIRQNQTEGRDYFVVKDIDYCNGRYRYKLAKEMDYTVVELFWARDLVPYGHSGLLVYPAIIGNRVKCHCGKTHQIRNSGGVDCGVYNTHIDIDGWYVRFNNTPIRKPRGQRQYVYYVAYCPECWAEEKRRRQEAEQLLPPAPTYDFATQVRGTIATQPEETFRGLPILQQRPEADIRSASPEPSRPRIDRPSSIWIHHNKGGR
jgi:hypothetical protein